MVIKYYVEVNPDSKYRQYATFELTEDTIHGRIPGTGMHVAQDIIEGHVLVDGHLEKFSIEQILENFCTTHMPVGLQWHIPSEKEQESLRLLYG